MVFDLQKAVQVIECDCLTVAKEQAAPAMVAVLSLHFDLSHILYDYASFIDI